MIKKIITYLSPSSFRERAWRREQSEMVAYLSQATSREHLEYLEKTYFKGK